MHAISGLAAGDIDTLVSGLERAKGPSFGGFTTLTMQDAREIYLSCL